MQLTKNPYNPNASDTTKHDMWQLGYNEAPFNIEGFNVSSNNKEYMAGRIVGLRDRELNKQGSWRVRPVRTRIALPTENRWYVAVYKVSEHLSPCARVGPWLQTEHEAETFAYNISKSMRELNLPLSPMAVISDAQALMEMIEMEIETEWDTFRDDPYEQFDTSVIGSIQIESDGRAFLTYDQALDISEYIPSWMEIASDIVEDPYQELKDLTRYALCLQAHGFVFEGGPVPKYSLTLDEGFFRYTYPDGTGGVSTSYTFASRTLYNHFNEHNKAMSNL